MSWTLDEVSAVLRATWSAATCDQVDLPDWSPHNPARGQCGVTALVLQELLGGELLLADVHFADGGLQGVHYWNRLPDGHDVDLTREQFRPDEIVGQPLVVERPPGLPSRGTYQYIRFRRQVRSALGLPPEEPTSPITASDPVLPGSRAPGQGFEPRT